MLNVANNGALITLVCHSWLGFVHRCFHEFWHWWYWTFLCLTIWIQTVKRKAILRPINAFSLLVPAPIWVSHHSLGSPLARCSQCDIDYLWTVELLQSEASLLVVVVVVLRAQGDQSLRSTANITSMIVKTTTWVSPVLHDSCCWSNQPHPSHPSLDISFEILTNVHVDTFAYSRADLHGCGNCKIFLKECEFGRLNVGCEEITDVICELLLCDIMVSKT